MFQGHPSWRAIIGFYIKGLLLVIAAIVRRGHAARQRTTPTRSVLVAFVGVALVVLAGFIKRIATHYTITTRRLHIKRGIVSREIQETRLERVQNVNYDQSVSSACSRSATSTSTPPPATTTTSSSPASRTRDEVVEQVDRATHADRADRASATSPQPAAEGRARRPVSGARSSRRRPPSRGLVRGAEPGGRPQRVGPVGALPGEVVVLAAEVAVGGGLLEDRPAQVEVADDGARPQVELLAGRASRSSASETLPVPKVSTISETGWATPMA